MVYFNQHIIFPIETRVYISMLILVLFLLVLAISFLGIMIYQLSIAIRIRSERLRMSDRVQARRVEGKEE